MLPQFLTCLVFVRSVSRLLVCILLLDFKLFLYDSVVRSFFFSTFDQTHFKKIYFVVEVAVLLFPKASTRSEFTFMLFMNKLMMLAKVFIFSKEMEEYPKLLS